MDANMSIKEQVLVLMLDKGEVRITELTERTGSSRQMVHRVLKKLLEEKRIIKIGKAPRTFYKLNSYPEKPFVSELSDKKSEILNENFILITETGLKLTGVDAFNNWCQRRELPFQKTVDEYIQTLKRYQKHNQANGLISGLEKLNRTKAFDQIGVDELYYLDFYAIERFGKTKLGTLLHFAKQGQNRKLMDEIIEIIKNRIVSLVKEQGIEAVAYIPPTIKREVQIMKVFERKLNLPLPHIKLVKVTGDIAIPQKALSKIEDRISNARFSIMVDEDRKFDNIILIDDAVGSGATINETAIKLKLARVATTVTGLAVTGSFKGFEVIKEI
jgi:DNA-binding transcriptional regulator GbsR (MarR family)